MKSVIPVEISLKNFYKTVAILFCLFSCFPVIGSDKLNNGYKGIELGMPMEAVRELLVKSPEFNFIKEEVLTIRIEPDKEILSTEGRGFIIEGYFHFYHDRLYQITLKLSEKKIGYYLLLKRLTNKYGNPTGFSPQKASWENEIVRIVIEKPCTIKYIDLPVWSGFAGLNEKPDNIMEEVRDNFVDEF